ncbi:Ig-like domain-containing protein, partial [Vibrio fluvialis]|nr:Ig-like domain-containing protein [Vibrio fluvialis]
FEVTPIGPHTIMVSGSIKLYANALYTDGSRRSVTHAVSWVSSDTSVATVDAIGNVQAANKGGTVVITTNLNGVNGNSVTIKVESYDAGRFMTPLTITEANDAGYENDGASYGFTVYTWHQAFGVCSKRGYRLPTKDELAALYKQEGDMSKFGWPVGRNYWTVTVYGNATRYVVNMGNGSTSGKAQQYSDYATCIKY